jgi:hypothetical protein
MKMITLKKRSKTLFHKTILKKVPKAVTHKQQNRLAVGPTQPMVLSLLPGVKQLGA